MLKGIPQSDAFWISGFNPGEDYYIQPESQGIAAVENIAHIKPGSPHLSPASNNNFENIVKKALKEIDGGAVKKVVLSRFKDVKVDINFQVIKFFENILKNNPHAYVYLLDSPELGCWTGATPELLLKVESESMRTVALAGSVNSNTTNDFRLKELDEQQFVTDYIIEILEREGYDFNISKTGKVNTGELMHLISEIYITRKGKGFEYRKLALDLHPTPAVCGVPREAAYQFIIDHEEYDRKLYTGFLGWSGTKDAALYVNIRCAQISSSLLRLYAGAGIVKGSEPEKEFAETEQKMKTLGNLVY